ncbi:MAG TPA: hypothetical protein VFB32_11535 [Rudaea sp.]|jgi:hypothetical protein|nr:hypothetical protein [Rudaea sp.]
MQREPPRTLRSSLTDVEALAVWRALDEALAPVLGHGSVAALFLRSVRSQSAQFPWLRKLDAREGDVFIALADALARQPPSVAAAAHVELVDTFRATLMRLLGASLAGRLLNEILNET